MDLADDDDFCISISQHLGRLHVQCLNYCKRNMVNMTISFVLPNHAKKIEGGYLVVFSYANYLAKRGHQVKIYYLMDGFVKRKRLPKPFQKTLCHFMTHYYPRWFKLDKTIQKKYVLEGSLIDDGDIVVATEAGTVEYVGKLDKEKGKKIYFIQGYETWACSEECLHATFGMGMTNIVVAEWLKAIVDKYSVWPSICIKNGVDSSIFNNFGEGRLRHSLAFHYRSAYIKGADIAIAVIRRLAEMYDDLCVFVVSNTKNVPDLPKCCRVFSNISSAEVACIDNQSRVFLCTSREEGYGLPGLEAMACGAAVVSTGYKGIKEYAVNYDMDHKNGNAILTKIDDIDELVNGVVRVFEDDDLYQQLSVAGIATAQQLTTKSAAEKFESTIIDAVQEF